MVETLEMTQPGASSAADRCALRVVWVAVSLAVFVVSFSVPRAMPAQAQTATEDKTSKPASAPDAVSEISGSESQDVVRIRVPVVVVRVVVRDAKGNVVENLKKEDFEVLDNQKPQEITNFAIEHAGSRTLPNLEATDSLTPGATKNEGVEAKPPGVTLPEQYVVLLLDDIHMRNEEVLAVRVQTMKVLESLNRADRVAVQSTSGRITQDFTNDRETLRQTVSKLIPAPMTSGLECANISYFQAQQIVQFRDKDAQQAAIQDLWSCKYGEADQNYNMAVQDAAQMSQAIYAQGDVELEQAIRRISETVNGLSEKPGQRAAVFVSPGFASIDILEKLSSVFDRAIKANVVVNTIDARGLFTPEMGGDASVRGTCGDKFNCSPEAVARFRAAQDYVKTDVLQSLAYGTGGTWFHNRNDLDKGFQDALSLPSTSYVIAFSPLSRNLDGKFHKIKVTLRDGKGASVQARTGYFAAKAKADADPTKLADAEFHDALFAQEEMNDVPIDLHTKFFLKQSNVASLSVLMHIDVKGIHFRKVSGRNYDELTVGVTIFDEHGNFITGHKRVFTLRLQDETLQRLHNTGLSVKMEFDVKPGTYIVRAVSRESEGARMSAHNGAVVIPN
jgi:VWFA-related protein